MTRTTPGKRQCKGERKAGGPCGANPLRPGTVLGGVAVTGEWCRRHDPDLPESARFQGGAKPGAGRPPNPRAVDLLRERLERDFEDWYTVLEDARTAERAIVVGSGESATLEMSPDHVVRLAAFREMLDRAYGKPRQATEISGPDGGPVPLAPMTIPDTEEYRRRVAQIAAMAFGVTPTADAADS